MTCGCVRDGNDGFSGKSSGIRLLFKVCTNRRWLGTTDLSVDSVGPE